MGTRNRKIRKQRSSRTHGWGTKGQHRDGGMKGGRGSAGRFKHRWTYILRHSLPRKGKHGFIPITKAKKSTINLNDLDEITRKLIIDGKEKEGKKIRVNLTELGYNKLLGEGKISRPLEIKVDNCSNSAQKKVESVGGSVIIQKK
jgi:large subunit ribosomal protein L15